MSIFDFTTTFSKAGFPPESLCEMLCLKLPFQSARISHRCSQKSNLIYGGKKKGTAKIQLDCSKWLFKVNYLSITFKAKYILRIMNLRDFFLSINRASFLRCYLVVFFSEIISYWFLSMQKALRLRPIFIGKWSW